MIPSYPVVLHGHVATLCQQFLKELSTHIRATKGCFLDGLEATARYESTAKSKTSDGQTQSENRWRPALAHERERCFSCYGGGAHQGACLRNAVPVSLNETSVANTGKQSQAFVFWFPGQWRVFAVRGDVCLCWLSFLLSGLSLLRVLLFREHPWPPCEIVITRISSSLRVPFSSLMSYPMSQYL